MSENAPTPPPVPSQKGIPALGWVGIGCGTILVIAIVVISLLVGWCKRTVGDLSEFQRNPEKAAAEMMVRVNPDLEMVSQDEATGEMTIRTKDGEVMTMSYKDIAEGKFLIRDAQGNTTEFGGTDLSKVPSWVPRVPDMKTTSTSFQTQQDGKLSGLYSTTTTRSAEELAEFFKKDAQELGVTSSRSTSTQVNGVENQVLNFEGRDRKLNIVITSKPGEDTQVSVSYEEGQ